MSVFRSYWQMMKNTGAVRLFCAFLVFYFADCYLIYLTDPALESYGDALWMGFSVATTIGLGDYTVTSNLARFLTILLGIYGTIMEAWIPGLVASRYFAKMTSRKKEIVSKHKEELARLHTLTQNEKASLAAAIRKENAA